MGTISRSHTIDGSVNWYYTYNYPNDVLITSDKIDVSKVLSSVQARWTPVYSYSSAEVYLRLYFTDILGKRLQYSLGSVSEFEVWAKNVTKTVPLTKVNGSDVTASNVLVNTSDYFNSSNPTTRRISITTPNSGDVTWFDPSPGYWIDGTLSSSTLTLGDLVLDVPPTATVSAISYDKGYIYAGLTTASVTVSDTTAYYGGSISSVEFTIGSQTVTAAGDGTLSIALANVGTFTPTVTVTDSRGQTYTETFAPINVLTYTAPSVSFDVERTDSTGKADDEGTYGFIEATLTFSDAVAEAVAPSVVLTDENGTQTTPTVTWYTDDTLTTTVTWASVSSGDTIYGLFSGVNTNYSYSVSVRPRDSEGTGTAISQTLSSAFYTIDFLAGGHGIAFGQPSSQNGFECNMPTTFHDTVDIEDDATFGADVFIDLPDYQVANTTDKAIYDAVVSLGWDSEVIV